MRFPRLLGSFFVFCGLSVAANASNVVLKEESSVVKMYSGRCGSTEATGSGVLFRKESRLFVLTSEHIIFNSSTEPGCHDAVLESNHRKVPLTLLRKDWASGLALLEVDEPKGDWLEAGQDFLSLIQRRVIVVTDPNGEAAVKAVGYPKKTKNQVDPGGKVLMTLSDRGILLSVREMIEVWNLWAEPGMSGGALFAGETGIFLGILSHLTLKRMGGMSSYVSVIEDEESVDHLFVIPDDFALNWMVETLNQLDSHTLVKPIVTFYKKKQKKQTVESICFGGLEFVWHPLDTITQNGMIDAIGGKDPVGIGGKDPVGIGGKDPVGIGGKDPVGIGGKDPVGIGGLDEAQPIVKRGVIEVLSSPSTCEAEWPTVQNRQWWKVLQLKVRSGEKPWITGLYYFGHPDSSPASNEVKEYWLQSLNQFFFRVKGEDFLPISKERDPETGSFKLKTIGIVYQDELDRAYEALRELEKQSFDETIGLFLEEIHSLLKIMESPNGKFVKAEQIRAIANSKIRPSWNALYIVDSENPVRLNAALRKIADRLEE
jgi:hypothetical protein